MNAGDKTPFPYNRVDTKGNPYLVLSYYHKYNSISISIINKFIIPPVLTVLYRYLILFEKLCIKIFRTRISVFLN
jgi:hypothetical protein